MNGIYGNSYGEKYMFDFSKYLYRSKLYDKISKKKIVK